MQEPILTAPTQHLTTRQAILIASRLFAAFLLFWVIADVIAIPRELLSVVHYAREGTEFGTSLIGVFHQSYLFREYVLSLLANIMTIALWLMIAGWFYRCGPRIQNFLLPPETAEIAPPPTKP